MVHEHGPRVMTNGPDIQWHWRNLNMQVHLSPSCPCQNDMLQVKTNDTVGTVPCPIGHGWNLFGLPGDTTSPSRFIRLLKPARIFHGSKPHHELRGCCGVVLGTSLLNNVFIPHGAVAADPRAGPSDGPEFTDRDYAVLKAPKEKVYMVRGYRNMQGRKIELTRLDISKCPLEDGSLGA
ncbi:yxeI [Symbiodinium sp. CCMP2456]|nr:yxeI [Symbiodinium sp. CCMP2456]